MDTAKSLLPSATGATAAAPRAPQATSDPSQARKTAEDFEAFYLSQVFENMFAGLATDPMFGGGSGENVYRSLLLQEYSKVAARSDSVGIADAVQREILRHQEVK